MKKRPGTARGRGAPRGLPRLPLLDGPGWRLAALPVAAVILASAAGPRAGSTAPTAAPLRACTVQALEVETQRRDHGAWTASTDFYPGDEAIAMLCRYRSTCTTKDPGVPFDVGFQLDGTTFAVASSADAKHLTPYEYVVAGQVPLPATFTADMMWPHSHAASCVLDPAGHLGEDASDNAVQRAVVLRPTPPEPAPASPARPPAPVPGMTLTPGIRFIGFQAQKPAGEGDAVAQPTGDASSKASRGGEGEGDARSQLAQERQRAQAYLERLRSVRPGGARPPEYVPNFPGIDRPVHLTSVGQMENYLRMVDGRLALLDEQAAARAGQGAAPASGRAAGDSSGAARRADTPARAAPARDVEPAPQRAAQPTPPGGSVVVPPGGVPTGLFGVRVPYAFTNVHAEVDSATLDCTVSKESSPVGALGWGRSVVALNGKDRSGVAQMTFQPFSGHTAEVLAEARWYHCRILVLQAAGQTHAVHIGGPDPVVLPAWAAAAPGSVLSVDGPLQRRE